MPAQVVRSLCLSRVGLPTTVVGGTVLVFVIGCGRDPTPARSPPPAEVGVITISSQPVANLIEVPGRLQAFRTAEVRARVDGIVERRLYDEGSDVRAGQALFVIDPREMRAQVSAARAALSRAEAGAANARQDVNRYDGLVAQQAISQQEYDTAVARLRTAEAEVAQMRAQVEAATLDLGYTRVTAPIAGRAGRAQVTEGALVSGASATLLTTIEQPNPIFVNFSLSGSEILAIRRDVAAGTLEVPDRNRVPVRLVLEDGTEYAESGRLDFFDLRVDEATGSTALRAEVSNPARALLPGQFVRVRVAAGVRTTSLLVPQRAVTVSPDGATVMVVGRDDIVELRAVKPGGLQGGSWEILEGLRPGERVIVEGLQKVRPGETVRVVPAAAPAAPAADAPGPRP